MLKTFSRNFSTSKRLSFMGRAISNVVDYDLVGDEWNGKINLQLRRVADTVNANIDQLKESRENEVWKEAMSTIQNIANSKKRHMFRPQLTMLGYYGAINSDTFFENEGLIEFAAGVELQHLFMLVHEDIMDKTTFRRNMPTILLMLSTLHRLRKRQEDIAHLTTVVGDLLFARSSKLLINGSTFGGNSSPQAVNLILNASEKASGAQFEELSGYSKKEDADETLNRILSDKAAIPSFVAPLVAGLHLAKGSNEISDDHFAFLETECQNWGLEAGASFHCLGVLSNLVHPSNESGKDRLDDIFSGRASLPLLVLDKNLKKVGEKGVDEFFKKNRTRAGRKEIFDFLEEHDVIKDCFAMVESHLSKAQHIETNLRKNDKCSALSLGIKTFNHGLSEYLSNLQVQYQTQLVEDELDIKEQGGQFFI